MRLLMIMHPLLLGLTSFPISVTSQRLITHQELMNEGPTAESIAEQIGVASIDVLEKDLGDLNGDGFEEFIAAIETPNVVENARERLVVIFQKQHEKWSLWKSSSACILNGEEGGVYGDPFEGIGIQDQMLHISHYGGSNWRWWVEDSYRFDGQDVILSKHSSYSGSLCDEKIEWTIDLTNGVAQCSYSLEECPEGFGNNGHLDSIPKTEEFEISKTWKITLEQRTDTILEFVSPKHGLETSL